MQAVAATLLLSPSMGHRKIEEEEVGAVGYGFCFRKHERKWEVGERVWLCVRVKECLLKRIFPSLYKKVKISDYNVLCLFFKQTLLFKNFCCKHKWPESTCWKKQTPSEGVYKCSMVSCLVGVVFSLDLVIF